MIFITTIVTSYSEAITLTLLYQYENVNDQDLQ